MIKMIAFEWVLIHNQADGVQQVNQDMNSISGNYRLQNMLWKTRCCSNNISNKVITHAFWEIYYLEKTLQ